MKILVGIATFNNRNIQPTIDSLIGQVDEIHVYDNEVNPNLTDNGKFKVFEKVKEPCYVFLCDDDLIYPPNYVRHTIEQIERYKCIITHHGRKLKKKDVNYYGGHHFGVACLHHSSYKGILHVAGTGVTAFRSDYFLPVGLHEAKYHRMADLVFSLEAAKQGKVIYTVPHNRGWIKQVPEAQPDSCYSSMVKNQSRLIEVSNEIIDILQS